MSTTHNPIPSFFHLCFPKDCEEAPARTCFFVNKRIDPNTWVYRDHGRDLGTLEMIINDNNTGKPMKLAIHNVYNPPQTPPHRASNLPSVRKALSESPADEQIILGDFNLHHELWGGQKVRTGDTESKDMIHIIEDFHLVTLLPGGTITYEDKNTQSCIDLCYGTESTAERIIKCGVDMDMDHNSDHLPITTTLDLRTGQQPQTEIQDWSNIDEQKLRASLRKELPTLRNPKSRSGLDCYVQGVITAIQAAIDCAVPLKRRSRHAKSGWTDKCKEVQMEARRLKRQNSRLRTEESWEAYRHMRNMKGRVVRQALQQSHRIQIEKAMESTEAMWKLAKWARNRGDVTMTTTPALKDPSTGRECTDAAEKAQLLKATFFPTPPKPDLQDIDNYAYSDQISFPDITEKEVFHAIKSTPPMKASGPDGIINLILHLAAVQIAPHLTRIFNWSLRFEYCPTHFRNSKTVVLRKSGKSDYTSPKAYRPIALLNTIGKLMDSILARRISYATEVHQLLPSTHVGGRRRRSAEHALHMITEKIYEAWNEPEPQVASLLLLDVSGAFDNVSHTRLLHNLRKRRIDERTVRWIASFLSNRSTVLNFDSYTSEVCHTTTGIPQGSPLSPILYLYYNADLIDLCNQEPNTLAVGYIDDVGILHWGRSTEETCNGLEGTMQKANAWARQHASVFAVDKFQLTHHTRKRQMKEMNKGVQIENTSVEAAPNSKYLGVTFDPKLQWKKHIENVGLKISKSIHALASLAGSTWGAKVTELRRIYQAVVVPQMLYGCSVWSVAQNRGEGYTRSSIDYLKSLQAKAARIIGGAYKSTSGAAMDVELHILPVEHQIWKANVETIGRMLSAVELPGVANIRSGASHGNLGKPTRYLSPLKHIHMRLCKRRGNSVYNQESIPPYLVPPWWSGLEIRVATSPERAKAEHAKFLRSPSKGMFVYTDGSGIGDHVGAAAVSSLTRSSKTTYMGDSETSTVYAAELQGIKLALQMAVEEAERGHQWHKLVIFTDNQAAIRTFQDPRGKSGAYIVTEAVALIDRLQVELHVPVEIRWVPAHTGIQGNEAADKAAKRAARQQEGEDSGGDTNVPHSRIYHLQTTLKTWVARYTRAAWSYNWVLEPRGRATFKYTPEPTHKILYLHRGLNKWQSALLIQMRTEKIGLRDHLWRRKVPGIGRPQCECGEGRQTVKHVVLSCREHQETRKRVFGNRGRIDLRAILNEPKLVTKAIRFMEQTQLLGQFRSCGAVQTGEA